MALPKGEVTDENYSIVIKSTSLRQQFEYENYKPRTREDLRDSGRLTRSEKYIYDFWEKHGTNHIDWDGVD